MKTKILAISMVALMMLSGLFVLPMGDQSDATDGILEGMSAGSWSWDRTTGYGPYNSFYAAFDIDDSNKLYAILDPYNLSKTIGGEDLPSNGHYSIMWVVPTVYWNVDNDGNLELSNDSSVGSAYAHTVDGHTYNYLAIGVYEATSNTPNSTQCLTSETNSTPLANKNRAQFQTLANANVMDSSLGTDAYGMIWNYYQWNLYRYISYSMMENFNAQTTVGYGRVYDYNNGYTTGATDLLGPYAGVVGEWSNDNGQSSVKMLIENAWGSMSEFIGGITYVSDKIVINTAHNAYNETTGDVTSISLSSNQGYPSEIYTSNPSLWGLGSNTGGSATTGLTDYYSYSGTQSPVVVGGGYDNTNPLRNGIGTITSGLTTSIYAGYYGTRLAFVFDNGPQNAPNTSYDYVLEYDSTTMSTGSNAISVTGMNPVKHVTVTDITLSTVNASEYDGSLSANSIEDVPIGATITVSGKTITIDGTSITAITQPNTAQYTYDVTWSVEDGDTVTENMTITATFTRSVNTYAVSVTVDPETDWGDVSAASFPNKDYGSEITISSSSITIGEDTITATPDEDTSEYDYGFDGFYIGDTKLVGGETITGTTDIVAKFTRTALYTVTIESSDIDKGTVSPTTITEVPEGTSISASGNTLTIGSATVTASPAEGFQVSWSVTSGTVEGDLTIMATFEPIQSSESVLMSLIPLIVLFAVVMLAASAFASFNGNGVDLIKLLIGLAVCVIVIATILIPAAGGI